MVAPKSFVQRHQFLHDLLLETVVNLLGEFLFLCYAEPIDLRTVSIPAIIHIATTIRILVFIVLFAGELIVPGKMLVNFLFHLGWLSLDINLRRSMMLFIFTLPLFYDDVIFISIIKKWATSLLVSCRVNI